MPIYKSTEEYLINTRTHSAAWSVVLL